MSESDDLKLLIGMIDDATTALAKARATASNDDFSIPGSEQRQRHVERLNAMHDATHVLNVVRRRLIADVRAALAEPPHG